MPILQNAAKHINRADTRLIVSRAWKYKNIASTLAFPADPSEKLSDLVWREDIAGKMRRQDGQAGLDGMFPEIAFRTAGTLEWDIALRMWVVRLGNIEVDSYDDVLRVRQNSLKWCYTKAKIEREIRAWQVLRDSSILTQGIALSAGQRFDDITSSASDPIAIFQLGAEQIKRNSGEQVDLILVPEPIHRKLMQHEKIQQLAVNKLNLSKDRPINGTIIEQLIGCDSEHPENGLVKPGCYKVVDAVFNNTPDAPSLAENVQYVYPTGNNVVMVARAIPGGVDGGDNGFGLGKYFQVLKGSFEGDEMPRVAGGNDGLGVFDFPDFTKPGGGTQSQLVDAWVPFVQQPKAGFLISGAADTTNSADYQGSLSF